MKGQLSQREQQVLWAVVNHYVATAEPVGSKALVESYTLNASPATIRNVMSTLDRNGLLYQPHTSAGRVPSETGYRVYVDNLLQFPSSLTAELEQVIADKLDAHRYSHVESLFQQLAQVLAALCGCIALVTAPHRYPDRVRHVQLIGLDGQQGVLILVSSAFQTASVRVEFTADIHDWLAIFNNFLNEKLRDRECSALLPLPWEDLDRDVGVHVRSLEDSLRALEQGFHQPSANAVWVSGLNELLRQPEFSQLTQVQPIVQILEEGAEALLPILSQTRESLSVKIGKELGLEPVQNCTLISCTYGPSSALGWVSILGPTRLPYEKAIASVEAASSQISGMLTQWN